MMDVRYMSKDDFDEIEASAKEKIKARNNAAKCIQDALARYVKTKTRARSKKAAMEKDIALTSPRYAKLAEYERFEDIREAYGYGCITESQADKLEDLWEEREQLKSKTFDGHYKDLVTECLEAAESAVLMMFEDEVEDYENTKREWDKKLREIEEEKRQRQEEYKRWKNGWTDAKI